MTEIETRLYESMVNIGCPPFFAGDLLATYKSQGTVGLKRLAEIVDKWMERGGWFTENATLSADDDASQ